mmetsp:Transcript_16068/g.18188  ORF Transcript_16068/g.18188 Transcript_16068/m.18188 type:complete len:315 (+) Transcript_16068:68-1012(+)
MNETEHVESGQNIRDLVRTKLSNFKNEVFTVVRAIAECTNGLPTAAPVSNVEAAISRLHDKYAHLQGAVKALKVHQGFQDKLEDLRKGIEEKEKEIIKFSEVVSESINHIEKELFEVARPLIGDKFGENQILNVKTNDILELAKKLSYSTRAPPGWHFRQNREIPIPFRPPAPQEENMKKGLLFTETKVLLAGLQETRKIKGEDGVEKEPLVGKEEKVEEKMEDDDEEDDIVYDEEEEKKSDDGNSKGNATGIEEESPEELEKPIAIKRPREEKEDSDDSSDEEQEQKRAKKTIASIDYTYDIGISDSDDDSSN